LFIDTDTVCIKFKLCTYTSNYELPLEDRVKITVNDSTVYDTVPIKGRVVTPDISLSGSDYIVVYVQNINFTRMRIVKIDTTMGTGVMIVTGDVIFNDSAYCYGGTKARIGDSVSCIHFEEQGPIDWDLYLVNDSTGDTCYWRNPFPEWGDTLWKNDNPVYQEYLSLSDSLFGYDAISCEYLPEGTYSVYVVNFQGAGPGIPVVNVLMGYDGINEVFETFIQKRSGSAINSKDAWFAGKIQVPQRTF
jgi:hypothetical protein